MNERVLIAGCGALGGRLGHRLAASGADVFGLRREATAVPAPLTGIAGDLTDAKSLGGVPSDWDWVIYCPTPGHRSEAAYRQVFLQGLTNLTRRIATGARWLFVSSTAVYAQNDGSWIDEESVCEPTGFNGRVLLEAEQTLQRTRDACVVRLAGLYGPGRERLIRLVANGTTCQADPPYWTNRIHLEDASALIAHLMTLPNRAACYVGVDDEPSTQCEVLTWVATQLGVKPPRAVVGRDANKRASNHRLKDTGFNLTFPNFRAGYGPLVAASAT